MRSNQNDIIDVAFYETFKEEEEAIKKLLPKSINAIYSSRTIQEEVLFDVPASVISIRTQSRIPHEWASKLKGVLARSQGYDHLVVYRREAGVKIPCGYLSDYCSRSVAEHAVMSMFVLLKQLKKQIHQFDQFDREGLTGADCFKKNALIVGVGHVGSQIVDMAKGLKMSIKGVDIKRTVKNLDYVNLKSGVAWADVIFCAAALTDKTKGFLGYEALKSARRGAILVNISRGEITPTADLRRLLNEEILGGMALDVYEDESFLADHLRDDTKALNKNIESILALKNSDRVLFTPHNAFNTQDSVDGKAGQSVESLIYFFKNKKFPRAVSD